MAVAEISQENQATHDGELSTKLIPIDNIVQSSYNPRSDFNQKKLQELAESIKEIGLLQPIVVRPIGGGDKYEIVAGERRYRACKLAKIQRIPTVIKDLDDRQARQAAIIENLKRVDINPIEQAGGFAELVKVSQELNPETTQAEVAKQLGIKTPSTLSNAIRLLDLPEDIQKLVADGKLSQTHGRALVSYNEYPGLQQALLNLSLAGAKSTQIEQMSEKSLGWQDWQKITPHVKELGGYQCRFEASTECNGCMDRRQRYCLKPECFAKKNQKVAQARAEELKEQLKDAGQDKPLDLDKLERSDWMYIPGDLPECRTNCEHRKVGKLSYFKDNQLVCLNPTCCEKLRAENGQRLKECAVIEAESTLENVLRELNETKYCAGTLQKITAMSLAPFFKNNSDYAVKQAAESLGLKINAKKLCNYSTPDTERADLLAGIHYEKQLLLAAETQFRLEATQYKNQVTGTANGLLFSKWFVGEIEKGPLYHQMQQACEPVEVRDRVWVCTVCKHINEADQTTMDYLEEPMDGEEVEVKCSKCSLTYKAQLPLPEAEIITPAAKPEADSASEIPQISRTIRVGDAIVPKSIQIGKKEKGGDFDKRLADGLRVVNHVNVQGDVTLEGGSLILKEELDSDWRYYMRPGMVRIGDHIADICETGNQMYEVINKTKFEVRLKPLGDGEEDASPSHPQWSTIASSEYVFVKRMGEVE